jgi:hypothetical protein
MSSGNLSRLSKILGHKVIKMTQRYASLSPEFIDRERQRLDTIWTPVPLLGVRIWTLTAENEHPLTTQPM